MRIPFDSIALNAILGELQAYIGAKVQGVRGPVEDILTLDLYANGGEGCLLLSAQPMFARAHFVTRRPGNPPQPLRFCSAVRSRLMGARLSAVQQVAGDRILEFCFSGDEGDHRLICELMGKHSNLFLLDHEGQIISAAKWVSPKQSKRVVQPGVAYSRPPVIDPSNTTLSSPFYRELWSAVEGKLVPGNVLVAGFGAYPFQVEALLPGGVPKPTLSVALEAYFDRAILEEQTESLRRNLLAQLDRVQLAREVAIGDLEQLRLAGDRATELQKVAELILAYGAHLPEGQSELEVWDYEGQARTLKLDPTKTGKENALAMFEKAKRAKARRGWVGEQLQTLQADLAALVYFRLQVNEATRLRDLENFQDQARKNRWLHMQLGSGKAKEDRPFEGHRIRQMVGPGNCVILYGENAESNDYLTARVARSNDWWLHIRGGTSAHVVVLTNNQPDRINKDQLLYAAKIAVQNSPSKHAGFVAVDYTLKKYVRKPRGAAKGTALYSNEKTLHVES